MRANPLAFFTIAAALLTPVPTWSQVILPGFNPSTVMSGDWLGIPIDRWWVELNQVSASTYIDGVSTQDKSSVVAPTPAQLNLHASTFQTLGSKVAASSSNTSATSVGSSASAIDKLVPDSTLTASTSYAIAAYWAVLHDSSSVTFDLKLTGTLNAVGSRTFGSNPSSAAVAAIAVGSLPDETTAAAYQLFANAGIDAHAEGNALLEELAHWPTTTQRNLATFGAQVNTAGTENSVDTRMSVTADGTRINCDPALASPCGAYFFYFNVFLFTGAVNGGVADFSHSLAVESFRTGSGPSQVFGSSPLSAVPEPSMAACLLLGLFGLVSRKALSRRFWGGRRGGFMPGVAGAQDST